MLRAYVYIYTHPQTGSEGDPSEMGKGSRNPAGMRTFIFYPYPFLDLIDLLLQLLDLGIILPDPLDNILP